MKKILIPVDSSEFSKRDVEEGEKKSAETMLNSLKETFGDMADKVEIVILEGHAIDEIVDYAKESDVDMIIVGSHGTGTILKRISLGSVTSKVLHYVEKPVMVVK